MPDGLQLGRQGALLTVPNVITFGRLCAVPLAVWLVLDRDFRWAFYLFVAAGVSDAVDGWLARRGAASAVGALLDPIADKALLVTMYITLAVVGILPVWLAILVVFRDAVIVGGVLVLTLLGHPVALRPLAISKFNTAAQLVLVGAALFVAGFARSLPVVMTALVITALSWAVAASTLASGGAYVWKAVRAR